MNSYYQIDWTCLIKETNTLAKKHLKRNLTSMQAAFIETLRSPDVVQVGEQPTPTINEDQVLVKVMVVTVNHVDQLCLNQYFFWYWLSIF